jgi:hypothetical protein
MKTTIQYFIDYLENTFDTKSVLDWEEIKKTVIQEEKEQIKDAYYGKIDGVFGYREEGQEYYNQTYNQNK